MLFNNRTSLYQIVLLLLASLALVVNCFHHSQNNHEHQPDFIDLSYAINNQTIHWVSLQDVAYTVLTSQNKTRAFNKTGIPYYVKSDRLALDLHSGTHMDAPNHFAEGKWSIDKIPFDRLMNVPTHVIDLSVKCRNNRTYLFTREDLEEYESIRKSKIGNSSVVLIYTGISESGSKGPVEYYGGDPKNESSLKIPGFSKEAALFLVKERAIVGVGLDAPSADGSSSYDSSNNMDPVAHEIFCAANVYILENINSNLKLLINSKFISISVLPLPIETGSGSPVRLVAQQRDQYLSPSSQTSAAAPSIATAVSFNFICMMLSITSISTIMYLK